LLLLDRILSEGKEVRQLMKDWMVEDILSEIRLEEVEIPSGELLFENLTFVMTGSLEHYKNRNELKTAIEEKGGKVTDSVTKNTDYLINNDILSTSSKNKKAKQLGIPIITEEQLIQWMESGSNIK
jgi:DNA ligase (NAD+)